MEAYNEYYHRHVYGNAKSDRSMILSAETASSEVYNTMWGPDEFNIKGVLKEYDCTASINQITAKTIFTCGEFDTGSPRACKKMSAKIHNSSIKIFKNCSHFPHLERKSNYLKCLRNFLNNTRPDGGFFQRLIRGG